MNENENTTYHYLQDAAKAVLTGKLLVVNVYIKKEISQINNLTFPLRKLENMRKLNSVQAEERK